MLLEITIGSLLLAAWRKANKRETVSEEQEKMYISALENLHDPDRLMELAEHFEKNGHKVQAAMLRKRAELRASSQEKRKIHREAYDRGMASTNPDAIEVLADAFEARTSTGAAAALRKRAKELRDLARQNVNGQEKTV